MKHERIENQSIADFDKFVSDKDWETTQVGCAFRNPEIKLSAMLSVLISEDRYVVDFFEPQKDWYLLQITDKDIEQVEAKINELKQTAKEYKQAGNLEAANNCEEEIKGLSGYKRYQKRKEYTKEEFEQVYYITYVHQLKRRENGTSRMIFFNN